MKTLEERVTEVEQGFAKLDRIVTAMLTAEEMKSEVTTGILSVMRSLNEGIGALKNLDLQRRTEIGELRQLVILSTTPVVQEGAN